MNTEPTITCPHCSREIKLTESLAAPLVQTVRQEFEAKMAEKEAEVSKREEEIHAGRKEIERERSAIDERVAEKLKTERTAIAEEEAKKAKLAASSDLDAKTKKVEELQKALEQSDQKLEQAQKAETDALRKQRELDVAKREIDLTVEKRVQASVEEMRRKAKQEVEEEFKLKEQDLEFKVTEKETQISSMKLQIEDLKKKAEQGSQQLQGEALELQLEEDLSGTFPLDSIEPVPKGESGADALQKIVGPMGQPCGHIIWEAKKTKNWNDSWLAKLKNDQRAAHAEIAVIVSTALPKDIETFGNRDGVWITQPRFAMPLAVCLRQSLIEVSKTRKAQEGRETKKEMVYRYLTETGFKHRVEAIVEKFSDMQQDLDRERKIMMSQWAKREKQIQGIIESTAGMYGDLQGIAGSEIQQIEGLDIRLLESGSPDNDGGSGFHQ